MIETAKLQEKIHNKSILLNYNVSRGKNPRSLQNNDFREKIVCNFKKVARNHVGMVIPVRMSTKKFVFCEE